MKKITLAFFVLACFMNVSAQIKVNSSGNVGIGKNPQYKNVFLSKMDNDELEELRKIVANKYADKLQNSDEYSLFSIKKTMLLAAVIINKQRKTEEQDVINTFIQSYNHLESNTLTGMSKLITE